MSTAGMPTPQERPDLYDEQDFTDRPEGWVNPIATPPELQQMIDARGESAEGEKDTPQGEGTREGAGGDSPVLPSESK